MAAERCANCARKGLDANSECQCCRTCGGEALFKGDWCPTCRGTGSALVRTEREYHAYVQGVTDGGLRLRLARTNQGSRWSKTLWRLIYRLERRGMHAG